MARVNGSKPATSGSIKGVGKGDARTYNPDAYERNFKEETKELQKFLLDNPTENGERRVVEEIALESKEAAFVMGRHGVIKQKISRVSGAYLEFTSDDKARMKLIGTRTQVKNAAKYIKFLKAQGSKDAITLDDHMLEDNDLTYVDVPEPIVGFVTGKGGNFLRTVEDEWGVLMFFGNMTRAGERVFKKNGVEYERLAIFGPPRARRGAELRIIGTVECKHTGYYKQVKDEGLLDKDRGTITSDWGTEELYFKDKEYNFALGRNGSTRTKLENASGCIVQYLISTDKEKEGAITSGLALFSGTEAERARVKLYLSYMFAQLEGPVTMDPEKHADSKDLDMIEIPYAMTGYITGKARKSLSDMEDECNVLMFFSEKEKYDSGKDDTSDPSRVAQLCVLSHNKMLFKSGPE